jgi:hypothetical protein
MTEQVENQEQQEVQYSEAEVKAMESGWLPKDQWEGDADDWVPAKQYIKNGELFGRINADKHRIRSLEQQVGVLVKHNEKVYESGYKAALQELKQDRKEALLEGDTERVLELDEKVEELQEEHKERVQEFKQEVQQANPTMHPSWEPWVERNRWYETDAAMRGYADGEAKQIFASSQAQGIQLEYDKLLQEVSRKVRQRFPEKFGNPPSRSATNKGDEDGGARSVSRKDRVELTPMEEEIARTLEKSGISRDKYIADLKKIKERKK